MQEEIKEAEVEVSSILTQVTLPLSEVINIKDVDINKIKIHSSVTLRVEDIPLFRGKNGVCDGTNSKRIVKPVKTGY